MLESFQRRSLPSHQPEQLHHDLDAVNRSTWQRRSTVNQYRKLTGWTDPGERAAVEWARPFIQGHPILDIGVGAGRTTPLLRSLGSDYLGIDYTPEMVEACRGRHPDSHFAHMDARNLQSLPANHYGLAVFSFNGIDSVAPAGRPTILAEVHRVLRPGGLFIVSSHNREGPGARERPGLNVVFTPNPLRLVWRVLRSLGALPRAMRNHRRLLAANEDHDECAVRNAGAHDFGLLVVYTTLAEQQRQLAAAGFEVPVAFDSERGESVTAAQETHDIRWFHCVARKRVTA